MKSFHEYRLGTEFIFAFAIVGLSGGTASGEIPFAQSNISIGGVSNTVSPNFSLGALIFAVSFIVMLSFMKKEYDREGQNNEAKE